jgi:hypothetical protein
VGPFGFIFFFLDLRFCSGLVVLLFVTGGFWEELANCVLGVID